MAEKKPTQKELAYQLFDGGYGPSDPEVKAVAPKPGPRRNYFSSWRKERGLQQYEIEDIVVERSHEDLVEAELKLKAHKEGPKIAAPLRVAPKMISIGKIEIPHSDWGYSSTFNLLLVAATYEEVCKSIEQGGFAYAGKVGDFCADCVLLFRRLFNFDKMKEEEYVAGGRVLEEGGEGEIDGQQESEE